MVLQKYIPTSVPNANKLETEEGVDDSGSNPESSDTGDDDDVDWNDWASDAQREVHCPSLFEVSAVFPSVEEALRYDKEKHEFDLEGVCKKLSLDFHARARLINYIRKEKPQPTTLNELTGREELFTADEYLRPVLEDDPLLQFGSDDWSDDEDDLDRPGNSGDQLASERRIRILQRKLAQAKQDLLEYRKMVEARFDLAQLGDQLDAGEASSSKEPRDDDTHYFSSYGENDIHAVMIQDKVRTASYASFILSNPTLFEDAVVLDVGCGTGILSLFAAKAGAKRVIAVDASDIAEKAERIIKANGLEHIITVVRGKVEDITLPDGIKHVDIIVSEWMGYALLYESMLDSVLCARDRFLQPGGVIAPSECRMMLGLCQATEICKERIGFWSDVYGFDLSAMAEDVYEDAIADVVGPESLVSEPVVIKDLHIGAITPQQLDFVAPFKLCSNTPRRTTVRAFLLYFDTFFTTTGLPVSTDTEVPVVKDGDPMVAEVWRVGGNKRRESLGAGLKSPERSSFKEKVFGFSTGPRSIPTHWKQTLFILREPFSIDESTYVQGEFRCKKSQENSRELDIEVHYQVYESDKESQSVTVVQTFKVR